jgi:hypothetical protein
VHVARYFGVSVNTVARWIKRDALKASFVPLHYTDDRPRDTCRRRYRIFERDLMVFIRGLRVKGKPGLGPGFWKGDTK